MLDVIEALLDGTGWYVIDDCAIECPCGCAIEWDGACGECGPSPLIGVLV